MRDGMYSDDDYYEDEYSGYGHTGDPVQDRLDYAVPDQVKKFLQYFQDMIKEGNVYEVNNLYENSFPKLTEQYFKSSPWPEAEEVAPYVNDDPIFLNLYRELYYRHIYARVQGGPTVEQRWECWLLQ